MNYQRRRLTVEGSAQFGFVCEIVRAALKQTQPSFVRRTVIHGVSDQPRVTRICWPLGLFISVSGA